MYIHRKTLRGEQTGGYKGDRAKYAARHMWAKANFENKEKCDHCGANERRLEWANISGKYKRERSDWIILCVPCHRRFDNKLGRQNLSLLFKANH